VLVREGVGVTLIERESVPGGLARGQLRGDNYYDLGVHMLHEFDQEILADVLRMMGDESIEVSLNAKIRWAGSFYRYPLQFRDILKGMSPWTLAYMIAGLLLRQGREKLNPSDPKDAEQALVQLYGRPLYRFFFKDFTHRYWGIPPTELSATFVRRKMPRLSAVDFVKKLLSQFGLKEKAGQAVDSALLEETLHYSRRGAEAMPRCIAVEIERLGGRLLLSSSVSALHVEANRIAGVSYQELQSGETRTIECDYCISTMPLPWMIRSIAPAPSADVLESSQQLRYKPIAVFGLLVKKEQAIDSLYVYYRDRAFHRVGEPKNAGLIVQPPGHTVLIVETTCEIGDPTWKGSPSAYNQIYTDLEEEGVCGRDEIVETHLLRAATGYPVFSMGFEPHLERVQLYVDGIPNLQSVGRQGGFCYPNMHSAMRMGAHAAENVLRDVGILQAVADEASAV